MAAFWPDLFAYGITGLLTLRVRKLNKTVEKTSYTFEEAQAASLDYFGGDELAARVWVTKYALKDSYGNIFEKNA